MTVLRIEDHLMADSKAPPATSPAAAIARARYGPLAPRFWHGMPLGIWLRLVARNRFDFSLSRVPTAAAITLAGVINTSLKVADQLIYGRKVRNTKIESPPLFILGHWRSGTTFLHELLIRDSRHTYPTTCQCFAPTHFLLSEWAITRCLGFVMPRKRPMDNMEAGWSRPQEDEFALCNMGVPSPYLSMAFPNHGPVFQEYFTLDDVDVDKREAWKRSLELFLKRVTLRERKRVVLKSPTHTARIGPLLELFPDARFIHVVRDPITVFGSTVRTWQALNYVQGLHVPRDESWLHEYVLQTFETMYASYEQQRLQLPESQLFELRYEDLVDDPKAMLRDAYDQLGLGDFKDAADGVDAYMRQTRNYRTSNYEVSPELRRQIESRWRPYVERFGYLTEAAETPTVQHAAAS